MNKVLTPTNYELIPLNDKTNVRFYTSIDAGSFVAPHWHDAFEIIYLQDGELKVMIGNSTYVIKKGQCILINPDQIHSTLCTRPNQAIVFQIPEGFLGKYMPNAVSLSFYINDPADTLVEQSKVSLLKETLEKMQFLADHQPDGAILKFNSLLFDVFFQLYHNFRKDSPTSDTIKIKIWNG